MKVGVIGSGGREHALCFSLKNSNNIKQIYCFPGNAGTNSIATNVNIDNKIQKAISFLTKGRTTIVIAHRLSTILNSDVIYVIDKGQVIDHGKHDELLKSSETYKNFYDKQLRKS